jgi:hypothetical protein
MQKPHTQTQPVTGRVRNSYLFHTLDSRGLRSGEILNWRRDHRSAPVFLPGMTCHPPLFVQLENCG